MSKLLFIDSDDINALSEALKGALERRGVIFKGDKYGEFGFPVSDEEEHDIDPYLGVMPSYGDCGGGSHFDTRQSFGGCGVSGSCGATDRWLFQESGGNYGGCGGSGNRSASCGSGGCGVGYNYYPRC